MWERSFEGHTGWVWSAQYSPDGLQVATASADTTAKLWSVATGECVATLANGYDTWGLAISPRGFIVTADPLGKKLDVWRA